MIVDLKLESILPHATCRVFQVKEGEATRLVSSCLYMVEDGLLAVSGTFGDVNNGSGQRLSVHDFVGPYGFFGGEFLHPALGAQLATALQETRFYRWDESLVRAYGDDFEFQAALTNLFVQKLNEAEFRASMRRNFHNSSKLVVALGYLVDRFGCKEDDGSVVLHGFTHKLLSEYVGTTREAVTHALNCFRNKGWLMTTRKTIIIKPKFFENGIKAMVDAA